MILRAALPALAVATTIGGAALAQPCCAGATALTPARLALHEDALVGLATRATDVVGSFDSGRRYVPGPVGDTEVDLEQDVLGAVRFFKRAQASVLVPIDATMRAVPGRSEWGGGLGDVAVGLRYDFLEAGESRRVPGLAALAGVTTPTGRATEDATTPLATSATGTGSWELAAGGSAEQSVGPFLLAATGSVGFRTARTVGSVHARPGPTFLASAAFAYTTEPGVVMGLSLAYTAELAGSVDGVAVPGGGTARTRLGASGGYAFSSRWRAQGVFFWDLPVDNLGQNEPVGMGASFTLVRSWTFS